MVENLLKMTKTKTAEERVTIKSPSASMKPDDSGGSSKADIVNSETSGIGHSEEEDDEDSGSRDKRAKVKRKMIVKNLIKV